MANNEFDNQGIIIDFLHRVKTGKIEDQFIEDYVDGHGNEKIRIKLDSLLYTRNTISGDNSIAQLEGISVDQMPVYHQTLFARSLPISFRYDSAKDEFGESLDEFDKFFNEKFDRNLPVIFGNVNKPLHNRSKIGEFVYVLNMRGEGTNPASMNYFEGDFKIIFHPTGSFLGKIKEESRIKIYSEPIVKGNFYGGKV